MEQHGGTNPHTFYTARIAELQPRVKRLEKTSARLSWLRLAVMAALVWCLYHGLGAGENHCSYLIAAGFVLALFLALVYIHAGVTEKRQYISNMLLVNTREADYIENVALHYDGGVVFASAHHAFTYDLDIFGAHSLFQHINRTVTAAGHETLAGMLTGYAPQLILKRQEAVRELSAIPVWRQQFAAHGMKAEESPGDMKALEKWLLTETPAPPPAVQILMFLLPAAFAGVLIAGSIADFNAWPPLMYLFLGNLLVTGTQAGAIRSQHAMLNRAAPVLAARAPMLRMVQEAAFTAPMLRQWQQQLLQSGSAAAIGRLAGLLERFDRLFNVVAAFIMNGLFQYHNHAQVQLVRWKRLHGPQAPAWLNAVAAFDAVNSMAGFAFNNPAYTYPVLKDGGGCLNARRLGHPLIPASKRITNDINFDQVRFYILTGSNMAGKSTFLRTLGLAVVMANTGLPVCAQGFEYSPMALFSSMRIDDSLTDSESYFYAELKRLRRLMTAAGGHEPCFVLLDEVLRGTNSEDKYSGTTGLLRQLMAQGARGVLATHDVKVGLLEKEYPGTMGNICFEAETINGQLKFDYQLRPGVSVHKSATQLMLQMGIIPGPQSGG